MKIAIEQNMPPAMKKSSLGRHHAILVGMPMLLVVAGIFAFWHFVSFAFTSNPSLNGLILGVMICGSVTMILHVRRTYREDRVFHAGIAWLKLGAWSEHSDPKLGPNAYVLGMLSRLEKLGLGHQLYIQSAAMEPELDALEHFFEKKQELSQFIVGLMVGLGLLGTFVGLLETLIATSSLIATIANSVGNATGGGMESEFARIVGGLQKPLSAMGTAFSASMFGLIGSIMLGFQMLVVRKAVNDFVEHVREEVLSLAEKTKVNNNVQITERFLATLLGDILEQHKDTTAHLKIVSSLLAELVPQVREAALSSTTLHQRIRAQEAVLERTVAAVGQVQQIIPVMAGLAGVSKHVLEETTRANTGIGEILEETTRANTSIGEILEFLPDQDKILSNLDNTLGDVEKMTAQLIAVRQATHTLVSEIKVQGQVIKRFDTNLWNQEMSALQRTLEDSPSTDTTPRQAD